MVRLFVSYRRSDTGKIRDFVIDRLRRSFGPERVFVDVANIRKGADFPAEILDGVSRATAVIVLIGKEWLGGTNVQNEKDFVRLEVEFALQLKRPLLPVLIDDARMPAPSELPESLRELTSIQALRLSSEDLESGVWKLEAVVRYLSGIGYRQRHLWLLGATALFGASVSSIALRDGYDCVHLTYNRYSTTLPRFVCVAALSVLVGGGLWQIICRLFRWVYYMGGSGNEPHCLHAIVWGCITGGPVILLSQWLAQRFDPVLALSYTLFCGLGAGVFYDSGIRDIVEEQGWSYILQEFIIILLWSFILSFGAALSLIFYGVSVVISLMPLTSVPLCGLVLILFYLPIRAAVGKFGPLTKPQDDQLRGLLAAVALRGGLFVGTAASLNCFQ